MNFFYVGIGGFIGAVLRVCLGSYMLQIFSKTIFPYPTLIINLLGSYILAYLLTHYGKKLSKQFKLFFTTGLLGSFTTFSTFSAETLNLLYLAEYWHAFIYILLSIIGTIFLAWLGFLSAKLRLENVDESIFSKESE